MYVEKIELENFRNYRFLNLTLNAKVNVILGKNGEGKTNLLEAIQFGLTGTPIRFSNLNDLIYRDNDTLSPSPFARLNMTVCRDTIKDLLTTQITDQKRRFTVNGKGVNSKSLNPFRSTVVFTPESLAMVKGGPGERRQLLDDLWCTFSPFAHEILADFHRCLASKNKVLRAGLDGSLNANEQGQILDSLNDSFLPLAVEVTYGRIQATRQAILTANEVYVTLLKSTATNLQVEYVVSNHSTIDWEKNQVYDLLASRLKELRGAETQAGISLSGPHKHDVRFLANGKDARIYCSQGQQRSIALAFKVAQARLHDECRGNEPILLLDDVFSELDSVRREQLLAVLRERRGQMVLTAIDDSAPSNQFGSDMSVFHVSKGQVI